MASGPLPEPSRPSCLRFATLAAAVAALGLLLVYAGALDVGFYYDDYHFSRPWSWHELRRVWLWSWDPAGIEPKFFRPLAAWMFAGRFWLFGLNSTAIHTVSLFGHGLCAVLAAWFLRREGVSTVTTLFGAWLYAIHPSFPYAQVSWATNQMHMADSIVVLAALLYWQRVRDRSLIWWTPLLGCAIVAFLFKEDGIMLLPAILVLTVIRERFEGGREGRRWFALAGAVALVVVALVAFRHSRLGALGGYGVPTVVMALRNFWKGLDQTLLLWPSRAPWQAVAGTIATATIVGSVFVPGKRLDRGWEVAAAVLAVALLAFAFPAYFFSRAYPLVTSQGIASGAALSLVLVGSIVALSSGNTRAAWIMAAGMAIALCFDVPFLLVSKREQYHLLTLGVVLTYAGSIEALTSAAGRPSKSALVGCVAFSVPFIFLARTEARDFLPCSSMVLDADANVHGWWVLPDQLRTWLDNKARDCHDGRPIRPFTDDGAIEWGVYEEQLDESGRPFRWTSDQATLMTSRATPPMVIGVRRPDATVQHPIHVAIMDGRGRLELILTASDWTFQTLRFDRTVISRLRDAQRCDVAVKDWFVPALADPKSSDVRRHGVELMVVQRSTERGQK